LAFAAASEIVPPTDLVFSTAALANEVFPFLAWALDRGLERARVDLERDPRELFACFARVRLEPARCEVDRLADPFFVGLEDRGDEPFWLLAFFVDLVVCGISLLRSVHGRAARPSPRDTFSNFAYPECPC
jgi:hypothetical protein